MGKIAFIFSGQGDQYPGMGKDIYEKYTAAKKIYELCDSIRANTSSQCFGGTEAELKETKNTQPCLFATELAAAEVLFENGIKPDALAGFSLGEVVAATVAGIMDKKTGFKLVCKRGELMQSASEKAETSMAAVFKLTDKALQDICDKFENVYPVNFNCPGQITVSGAADQMPEFFKAVKEAKGKALPLKVKGAFHSPFMSEAANLFSEELKKIDFSAPQIPLYSNLTAEIYSEDIVKTLSEQICNPVLWEKLIRNMIASGIDTFIEIGPGKTLTNMINKIDSNVKAFSACDMEAVLGEVKGC
ncbi:MAG: ACP S-malonyltransferase [Firmicutes bacterium]|nr:ACP S-malonyltransferase [Bacillota bacterium]